MTKYEEIERARRFVEVGARLDGAAVVLRTLIRACAKSPKLSELYGFSLSAHDVADDLRLECAHGQIRVAYDQVIREGTLVGRFTFFLIKNDVLGELKAVDVYAILFNAGRNATLHASGEFEWSFADEVDVGYGVTRDLMGELLLGVVATLPTIAAPRR